MRKRTHVQEKDLEKLLFKDVKHQRILAKIGLNLVFGGLILLIGFFIPEPLLAIFLLLFSLSMILTFSLNEREKDNLWKELSQETASIKARNLYTY